MEIIIPVLRWFAIGFIDWFFKSRRVVKWTNEGLLYRQWPPFWRDQGAKCWRGVLFILAVSCVGYDIFVGEYFRAVVMALTFNLEFRFYWWWVSIAHHIFGTQRQKQDFETTFSDPTGVIEFISVTENREPNFLEVPSNPKWLQYKGVSFVWYHDSIITLIVLATCTIAWIFLYL